MSDKCECVIGKFYDGIGSVLVSYHDLLSDLDNDCKICTKIPEIGLNSEKVLSEFVKMFSKRKTLKLNRFNYCPYCGKKIDWKDLRQRAKKYADEKRAEYE